MCCLHYTPIINTIQEGRYNQEQAERIYNSYRDYIKHEDTLGNARINILIASQAFLFIPYFASLKSIKQTKQFIIIPSGQSKQEITSEQITSVSNFDLITTVVICLIGFFINELLAPSIFAFIDSSLYAEEKYKQKVKTKLLEDYPPLRYGQDEYLKIEDEGKIKREWHKDKNKAENYSSWIKIWTCKCTGWGVRREKDGKKVVNPLMVRKTSEWRINKIHRWFQGIWVILFLIASLTALTLALPNLKAQSPQTTPSPAVAQSPIAQQDMTDSPRRLAVTVKVQEPQDLKVQEGSQVKKGQVIAARDREKQRLESQKQQLTLSLQKLQSFTPLAPTPPQPVPAVRASPRR